MENKKNYYSLVAGTLTIEEYINNIKVASGQMRANLLQ